MNAALERAAGIVVRDATSADNQALIALTAACPMAGDLTLCVDRAPDFFALSRLEGERWRVGVAEGPGHAVIGCVAVAERRVYLSGRPAVASYIGDLKVHPAFRGSGAADALIEFARRAGAELGGAGRLGLLAILAGNRAMERLAQGPRGLPVLSRFATLRTHAIPLVLPRRCTMAGIAVAPAQAGDLEEMAALWRAVAPDRQFSPVLDADALARWITDAPGLRLADYLAARLTDGRLAGFLGVWDQTSFKQLRVVRYSRRLAAVRAAINAAAPLAGATPLPPAGAPLRHASVVHLCVPPESPEVLRALLLTAYDACEAEVTPSSRWGWTSATR